MAEISTANAAIVSDLDHSDIQQSFTLFGRSIVTLPT